ncbi:MAG TPA: ClbS/DfsB family four-helix bundle protein [Saprospiraceae bacterium]|nr:ClbS/DfsB family four-helix bundle protein [Saprospiraceae bacterium]HMQ81750.1 ClbS/DfsB family four-helix bundle protein [Saprospiraceae bacterium]
MPRPAIKKDLLQQSQENFNRLIGLVDAFPPSAQEAPFPEGTLNRNIRDVLAHLHHWHLLFLDWYEVGMDARKPIMPAPGYTWKTLPELNRAIWNQYQYTPLQEVKLLLHASFQKLRSIIERHSDEELFEKKRYPWTGSTSLGAYLVSATSSHYDWAYKLIRRCKNTSPP